MANLNFGIDPSTVPGLVNPTLSSLSAPAPVAANPVAIGTAATPTTFKPTQGWYIFAGIIVGVSLSGTRAAPLIMGILSLALIYQLSMLLEHVPPGQGTSLFNGVKFF